MLEKLKDGYGRQFDDAVRAVRGLGSDVQGVNPEYLRGQVELILSMGMFTETVEREELTDFIFPAVTEFVLEGVKTTLKAVDSGRRWNGWRVPSVTSSQLLDYLVEARHELADDAYRGLLSNIFDIYGDGFSMDNPDRAITRYGLTWELASKAS